jgi:hypothetical protein
LKRDKSNNEEFVPAELWKNIYFIPLMDCIERAGYKSPFSCRTNGSGLYLVVAVIHLAKLLG